jgi:maltooligosyltrehalose trehalohydrolase
MTALLLLGPWVPLLLQGQDFGSTRPFLFFADHHAELAAAVEAGRREFLRQFRNTADEDIELPSPHDPRTFESCVLDDAERAGNDAAIALHRDLMRLRAGDPVIGADGTITDGATIDPQRFLLRMRRASAPDRLLVVNLGSAFDLSRVSEPLVAPPASGPWHVLWHSERPQYEGSGMPPLEPLRWEMPGQAAVLLGDDA